MSSLTEYINKIKLYISDHKDMSETEIVKYVYLDLGKRLSFDENYYPFGNSKKRQNMYKYHSKKIEDLNECMEKNKAICKSISYILEYVLKSVGINIKTMIDSEDLRSCPHTHNLIKEKNGRQYFVDLQEDIYNIQSHSFTKNFGYYSIDDPKYVVSRFEQEQIDRKIGYIDDQNYYSDDYLHLLKHDASFIDDFDERVEFILENIEIYDNPAMGYIDRQWHHKTILEELFSRKDFDYKNGSGKIKILDCYKEVNDERKYLNCISVQAKNRTDIYVYNNKASKYCKIDLKNFARAVKNGLRLHRCNIQGLREALKELDETEER